MITKEKKKPTQYVDNKELEKAILDYKKAVREAKKLKKEPPPRPNFIGECFVKIATHLSYSPNFLNYSFREEMIADGVENCLMYFENYNPDTISKRTGKKTMGPFPYFTQIIYYAFCRRIAKEKKQQYIKAKVAEQANLWLDLTQEDLEYLGMDASTASKSSVSSYDNMSEFISNFEDSLQKKKDKKKEDKKRKADLDLLKDSE